MIRKLTALAVATVVAFALLPALAASAAPASTATLTSAKTVFPSGSDDLDRADTPFTIEIVNDDGLGGLLSPINAISITFPPNVGAPDCGDISGWDCVPQERPGPDALLLRGGMIIPGDSASFTFGGVVGAPRFEDLNGMAFTVDVSSDNGQTYGRAGGDTAFNVRVFQVLGITIDDAQLTGGLQNTTASFTFRDHSSEGVAYDPALTLENGQDQQAVRTGLTPAQPLAAADGVATFDIITGVPQVSNGSQNVTVRADAQAAGVVAEAPAVNLVVERSPEITLDPGTLQINGGDQGRGIISRGENSYTIRIRGAKLYPPAVLAADGFESTLTLEGPGVSPITLQLSGESNTQELPRGHAQGVDLTWVTDGEIDFLDLDNTTVLDAYANFTGTDDNGAPFDITVPLLDLIEIDVDIPLVSIEDIFTGNLDPTRVKDGDLVTIQGLIQSNDDEFDISLPDDFLLTLTSPGYSAATGDFDITFDNGSDATSRTFEATINVASAEDVTLGDLGVLTATAQVNDWAGNSSLPANGFLDIDNLQPLLSPRDNGLGYYYLDGGEPRVRVTFDDGGGFGDVVFGGCFPTQWSIPGVNVTEVQYFDGTGCFNDADGPDGAPAPGSGDNVNDRILVLDSELDLGDGTNDIPVNYDAAGGMLGLGNLENDVTDQALNTTVADAATIVDGRIPNIPVIELFERGVRETAASDDFEPANSRLGCRDEGAAGCDTLADATNYYTNDNVQLALSGGRFSTDDIEIYPIVDPTAEGDARYGAALTDIDYTEDRLGLDIDVCTDDCERNDQLFGVRLVREVPRGNNTFDYLEGPVREFLVSFDRVDPALGSAVAGQGDGDDVLVNFTEDLFAGYDAADDWSIEQANTDPNAGDGQPFYTRAQSVSPTDQANQRLIGAQPLDSYPVTGSLYEFISDQFESGAMRYEDFAGNFTGDGFASTP